MNLIFIPSVPFGCEPQLGPCESSMTQAVARDATAVFEPRANGTHVQRLLLLLILALHTSRVQRQPPVGNRLKP